MCKERRLNRLDERILQAARDGAVKKQAEAGTQLYNSVKRAHRTEGIELYTSATKVNNVLREIAPKAGRAKATTKKNAKAGNAAPMPPTPKPTRRGSRNAGAPRTQTSGPRAPPSATSTAAAQPKKRTNYGLTLLRNQLRLRKAVYGQRYESVLFGGGGPLEEQQRLKTMVLDLITRRTPSRRSAWRRCCTLPT